MLCMRFFNSKTPALCRALLQQKRYRFQKADTHLCLLQDVKDLGNAGDIVLSNLSRARNHLVPEQLAYYVPRFKGKAILPDGWSPPVKQTGEKAIVITPAILENGYIEPDESVSFEKTKSKSIMQDQERLLVVDQLEKVIEAAGANPLFSFQKVQISKDDAKIFGSVSAADIQKELLEKYQVEIPKECFPEGFRLKQVGTHSIVLKIQDRKISMNIEVKSI